MAEAAERMAAKGVRSSWDAAAVNSICRWRLSRMGRSIRPVKYQENSHSAATAKATPRNTTIRCRTMLRFIPSRENTIISSITEFSLATTARPPI